MIQDPLSFLQNVPEDLSTIVRKALTDLGVDNDLLNDFDAHSTIEIELADEVLINLSLMDDRLYIWSLLSVSEEVLIKNAIGLITVLTELVEHVELNQYGLSTSAGGYQIKAIVNIASLNSGHLGDVIAKFYDDLVFILSWG